jgi:hypothetical protein
MTFDKAIQVLSYEIDKMKAFREPFGVVSNDDFIAELRTAIQVLRDGQGYLTNTKPVKVFFYSEL